MSVWPCQNIIDCECGTNPYRNLSAEDPDPPNHFARSFPPFPPLVNSPIDTFRAPGCVSNCFSVISQFDADACALRQATQCNYTTPTGNPPGPQLFGNEPQSCEVPCAMGDPFIYSIPPGTYLAPTVELANLIAQSFCYNQAFSLRQCETPPGPPVTVCPRITGVSPAGPIHASVGQNVTLMATYSFPGSASALMFIWFLNGSPIAILHDDPTLNLGGVMESDAGDYTLAILANGCSPVFSNNIVLTVTNCPAESGPPAPTTLDIEHPVEWETWTINNGEFATLISSDGGCNPTFEYSYTSPTGLDHAPGIYGERYVSGFFDSSTGCPGATPVSGTFAIFELVNEKYNIDSPASCNYLDINNGVARDMPGDPPPINSYGGGLVTACRATLGEVQSDLTAFWTGKVISPNPYPPDQILSFPHENDGGMFTVYTNIDPPVILSPLVFKILQIDGQIPQPRKLAIFNYAALVPQFSNPSAASNWDGTFQTRDNFDSTTLNWLAPAGGSFGGAKLEWVNSHPNSANGFGWKLTLFNSVFAPFYVAYKGIDATSEGRYYRDAVTSPAGPECLFIDDISETLWYPGTHP